MDVSNNRLFRFSKPEWLNNSAVRNTGVYVSGALVSRPTRPGPGPGPVRSDQIRSDQAGPGHNQARRRILIILSSLRPDSSS